MGHIHRHSHIRVVFDDDHAAAFAHIAFERLHQPQLIAMKVERVGSHEAVERRHVQWPRVILGIDVQGDLRPAASAGAVRIKTLRSDADIFAWYAKVAAFHERTMGAQEAGLAASQWYDVERVKDAKGRVKEVKHPRYVASRELSLLEKAADRFQSVPAIGEWISQNTRR